ncbi:MULTISPECIES: ParB/RepB/Spo0J family partition protein [Streptomyces]|uniref:ParB/RepB/Spo0J family partition protein n=1 Tax=Streptomyces ehimensis TaxID=68195 RepID=A0ABV9BQL9_9ACTN
MTRAADRLGAGTSFGQARPVSARRAAIAAATEAPTTGAQRALPETLAVSLISENPDNPRERVGDVSDLASTIREVGLVQAITVATVEAYLKSHPERAGDLDPGARYVVVDGHRRLAAIREVGLEQVKYVINDDYVSSDEALLEAAFVANYQREGLSDLEEAAALEKLVKYYGSQGKAAKRLGVTQPFISQRLSLLELDPALQADLEAGVRKVEHVRGLSRLSPQEQREKADARAAEAQRKAEEKQQKRRAKISAEAEASDPDDAGAHNAVMGEEVHDGTAEVPAQNVAVVEKEPASVSHPSPLPAARSAVTPPKEAQPLVVPDAPESPWDDPSAVLRMLRKRMRPTDLRQLAEALLEVV